MSELPQTLQPLRAKKPTLLDLWMDQHFDIPQLATDANIPEDTVQDMVKGLPVTQEVAVPVLTALSATLHKDLTLETVHVVLKQQIANKSEVARMRALIDAEYTSAVNGLHGLAEGIGKHIFITKRMENISNGFAEIAEQYGEEAMLEAMMLWDQEDSSTSTSTPEI